VDAGRFRSRYSEVMGDIHVAQGRVDRARAAYGQALSDMEPGLVDRVLVQMKLDDLPAATDGAVEALDQPTEEPSEDS
jgi:predicted negative regulator of RcsB-dependent stress response